MYKDFHTIKSILNVRDSEAIEAWEEFYFHTIKSILNFFIICFFIGYGSLFPYY